MRENIPIPIPIERVLEAAGEAAPILSELTQIIMRREGALSTFEKELVAAWVSHANQTPFCSKSHTEIAMALKPDEVDRERLAALLELAEVLRVGRHKREGHINSEIFSSEEKIELAFVVALFKMFNSLIDSLTHGMDLSDEIYAEIGRDIATNGYIKQKQQEVGVDHG